MDRAYIVALVVIVVVVVASFVAIWASVLLFPLKPASEVTPPPTNAPTPAPTTPIITPSPQAQPTPAPIIIPTPAPALSPTPPSSTATITIQQKGVTYSSLLDKYGLTDTPDPGNVWLVINMTITNKGYTSFNTNPNYFTITINNIKYSYDGETFSYGNWNTVDILNGGSYTGSLVFQVPNTTTTYTLNYERYGETYNIVYQ